MKGQLRITEVFAFIVVDKDGSEGVPAIAVGPTLLPMIAADRRRLDSLRPIAEAEARRLGVQFTLARFSVREDLETYGTQES